MLTRMRRLIAPPVFAGDEQKTQVAEVLNAVLLALLVGCVLYSIIAPLIAASYPRRLLIVWALIFWLLGMLLLMRRGHLRFASSATVVGLWFILTLTVATDGGVRSLAFGGYMVVVLSAGLLLGLRPAIGVAIASAASGLALIYAVQAGILPTSAFDRGDTAIWLVHSIYLLVAAALLGRALRSINRALERAHRELGERRQVEASLRQSEALLRGIIDNTPAVIYMKRPDGRFLLINRQFEKLFGVTLEQIRDKTDHDIFPKEAADLFRANDRQVLATGAALQSEEYAPHADGTHAYISVKFPLLDASGQPNAVCGISTDITARQRMEAALRESELRYRTLVEKMGEGLIQVDNDDVIQFVNDRYCEMTGYTRAELVGKRAGQIMLISDEDRRMVRERGQLRAQGQTDRYEVQLRKKSGEVIWVEVSGARIVDASGAPIGSIGVDTDITARKLAEAALRESEHRYRVLYNQTPAMLHSIDRQGRLVSVSDYWLETLGYMRDEVIGRRSTEFLTDESRRYAQEVVLPQFYSTGFCKNVPYRFVKKNGEFVDVLLSAIAERDTAGEVVRSLAVLIDVGERRRAEEALRESEERYRVISDLVSDYAFSYQVEADGAVTLDWATDALTRITGYTMDEMRTLDDWQSVTHPEDLPIARRRRQRLHAGQPDISEYRMFAKDGRTLWLRFYSRSVWDAAQSRVVRVYGAVQDITRLKHLEQQLAQAQKMEAVGQLAGGIAHDFNNVLTVILSNCDLILDELEPASRLRDDIGQIQGAAARAAELTQQLLAFSRQQVLQPHILNLNDVVATMEKLLRPLIGEHIKLLTRLQPDLGQVNADPGRIEQVVMNLAINARDAMPNGGTLLVETANAILDESYAHEYVDVRVGPYVMLAISDTGSGMDAATRARIFEPFFTTKAQGKGTGLGLATVHGIVNQSGGHIWVYSEPEQGTTFKIYLPRAEEVTTAPRPAPRPTALPRGSATILLVEDERVVRELASRILHRQGYRILEATDGQAALRIAGEHAEAIDLLLTDVVMPGGFNGRQLAEQLVSQRPGLKVLYMSGYTDDAITHYGVLGASMAYLQKPFTPDELIRKVLEVLES